MSNPNLDLDVFMAGSSDITLHGRIKKTCQIVRFTAVILAGWLLLEIIRLWSNVERIDSYFGPVFKKDLSGIEPWQQFAGSFIYLLIWSLGAAACYSIWRVFSAYLNHQIFSLNTTLWLKRAAMLGLAAKLLDICARPLISVILTLHFPAGQKLRLISLYLAPNDLIILALLLALFAIAHILMVATEIAQDNAQIV